MQPIKICPLCEVQDDCDVAYAFLDQEVDAKPFSLQDEQDVIFLPTAEYINPLWALYQHLQESTLLVGQVAKSYNSTDTSERRKNGENFVQGDSVYTAAQTMGSPCFFA